jgi:hypothetical protein
VAEPVLVDREELLMSDEGQEPVDKGAYDRRLRNDRRGQERRKKSIPVALERREGGERRQQGERRRQVDPTTCERDYKDDEIAFMRAMDDYKRYNHRPFPTWSEVLEVLTALGYRKVADPTPIPGVPQNK